MATGSNYPTSLDSFTDKVDGVDDILADETNAQSSAIEALEAKVGITDSSDPDSIEYKVNNVILTDPTTTKGDLIKRGDSALGRLPVGDAGQVLAVNDAGDDLEYADISGGSGDNRLALALANSVEKLGGKAVIPSTLVDWESFTDAYPQNLLQSDYTAGTTVVLVNKITVQENNYKPFLIVDPTNENVEVVIVKQFTSGSTGAWNYEIASALSNSYTTANGSYVCDLVGLIENASLQKNDSWTANIAKFILGIYLRKVIAKSFVKLSIEVDTDTYPVESLADWASVTRSIEITADATNATYFNNNEPVWLIKLLDPDADDYAGVGGIESPKSSAFGTNAVRLLQSANGSESGGTTTLEFDAFWDFDNNTWLTGANIPDIGSDTDDWVVVREAFLIESLVGGASLSALTDVLFPKEVRPYLYKKEVFEDTFNRSDSGTVDNSWGEGNDGGGSSPSISSNKLYMLAGSAGTSWVYRNAESYDVDLLEEPLDLLAKVIPSDTGSTTASGWFTMSFGSTAVSPATTGALKGITAMINESSAGVWQLKIYEVATERDSDSISITDSVEYMLRMRITKTKVQAKIWQSGTNEPIAWNCTYDKGSALTLSGDYLNVGTRSNSGVLYQRIDNIWVGYLDKGISFSFESEELTDIEKGFHIVSTNPNQSPLDRLISGQCEIVEQ